MTKKLTRTLGSSAITLPKTAKLPASPKSPANGAPAPGAKTAKVDKAGVAAGILRLLDAAKAPDVAKPTPRPKVDDGVDLAIDLMTQYDNGQSNACGTTSQAMILNYFAGERKFTHQQADAKIRTGDMFSAPDELIRYAESQGFRGAIKSDAGIGDIKKMLDQGVPVQVLIDPGKGSDFNLHWVAVTGYKTDAKGNVTGVVLSDPAGGVRKVMPVGEFLDKWSNLKMGGLPNGMSRMMLTYVPKGDQVITAPDGTRRAASDIDLPSNGFWDFASNSQPGRVTGVGVVNMVNGWNQKDAGKMVTGFIQTVGGGLATIGSAANQYLQKPFDWGRQKWKKGGIGNKILGAGAMALGAPLKAIGWIGQKASNIAAWAVDKGAKAVGKVVNGVVDAGKAVGNAVVDAGKAVVGGVKSAGKAIGKGIKKVFSGW